MSSGPSDDSFGNGAAESAAYHRRVLSQIAREAARRFGDRLVVAGAGGPLTYRDLDRLADDVAAGLTRRGLGEGDVVALVLPSGGDWLVTAVAAARVGATLAGVSTALSAVERADQVDLVRARLVIATASTTDGLPLRSEVVAIEPGGRSSELAVPGSEPPEELPADPERPVVICFTSGTTGVAKGALFRERHLAAVRRIDLGEAEHTWGGGSPMLASTQFAHVGMALKMPWYLQTGATLHVLSRWRADDALRLVAEHRMPTLGVVAPQLALMLRSPLMEELDLDAVRMIIAGGAASPPDLVDQARRRFGAAYSIRYSSTESGGVGLGTAFDAPDDEALHTVGRPRQGVEVRIAGEGDRPVTVGDTGELQLRSPAVMDGYHRDPAATRKALSADGWLRTGDLARIRTDGAVVLCGRRTDMYIRGGYNVFPEEVEAVLTGHPGLSAVAVTSAADEVMGEVGVAVVVPSDPDRPPTLDELRSFAGDRLSRHKLPERIVVVEELPLTSAQKLDRRTLRSRITGG
jgi:acyl-CoA synthetase (AMP-forming)/AMP-acid ligase II